MDEIASERRAAQAERMRILAENSNLGLSEQHLRGMAENGIGPTEYMPLGEVIGTQDFGGDFMSAADAREAAFNAEHEERSAMLDSVDPYSPGALARRLGKRYD
jgi:hypothetical protein